MQGTSRFKAVAVFVLLAFAGVAQAQNTVESAPTATVTGRAPTISSVTISGTGSGPGGTYTVGDELTVSYVQADADGDAADATATDATIQWYSGTTAVGDEGSKTYEIVEGDLGKIISVRLTPHTSSLTSDPYQGTEAKSDEVSAEEGGGYVTVPDGTRVITIAITGDAEVGDTLTAVPSCGENCDERVTFQWQVETGFNTGTYTDITNETGLTYVPKGTDQKKKIRVVATNP